MVGAISQIQNRYDRIFITNKYGRPYIYILFYQHYSPRVFWGTRDAERDWYGFWTVNGFGKYRFGPFPSMDMRKDEKWLFVAGPEGSPKEANAITTISFPGGETAFEIGEVR